MLGNTLRKYANTQKSWKCVFWTRIRKTDAKHSRAEYADFKPVRGDLCARKAIEKYFGTKSEDPVVRAGSADLVFLLKMRYAHHRQPVIGQYFARPEIVRSGACYNNGNNWWTAVSEEYPDLAEFARKLNNGFGGQGASERWNKEVTLIRTKSKNRQAHEVTLHIFR